MNLEYNVSDFDTLNSVATKFGVSVKVLKEYNCINGSLPKKLIIPMQNPEFSVVANFNREFLFKGDGSKIKNVLSKHDLFCSNLNADVCLFKPKNNNVYVVGVLDNLQTICSKFNLNKQEVKKINDLATDKLFIGQILKLK